MKQVPYTGPTYVTVQNIIATALGHPEF